MLLATLQECVQDKVNILPGELWDTTIQSAIRRADFFLVCISSISINKRGYLQKEIQKALDIWKEKLEDDIYFIPCRLEKCELPRQLSCFQWVDLFEQQGISMLMRALETGMQRRKNTERDPLQVNEGATDNDQNRKYTLANCESTTTSACSLFGGRNLIIRNMTELARYALLKLENDDIPMLAQQLDLASETLFAILGREKPIDINIFYVLAPHMDFCVQDALGKPHFTDENRKYWHHQYLTKPIKFVASTGGFSIEAANTLTLEMYVTFRAIAELTADLN